MNKCLLVTELKRINIWRKKKDTATILGDHELLYTFMIQSSVKWCPSQKQCLGGAYGGMTVVVVVDEICIHKCSVNAKKHRGMQTVTLQLKSNLNWIVSNVELNI